MSGPLAVAELAAWVILVGLLASATLLGLAYRPLRARLEDLPPRAREAFVMAWAATPWVLAGAVTLACFLPSLGDWLGLLADHCGFHGDHHPHLCFHHPTSLERSAAAGALGGLVAMGALAAALAGARGVWRYLHLVGGLTALAEPGPEPGVSRVATRRPLALTLGLLRPRVLVSEGLEAGLEPGDLAAVLAHERGHVRRRDGLRKLALAALALPFPPPLRRALLEDHALACEQRCDLLAAESVGSPAVVARALLAVTRLDESWDAPVPSPACHFGPGRTAQRVRALLEPGWREPAGAWLGALGAGWLGIALAAVWLADPLHHSVETALALVFGA